MVEQQTKPVMLSTVDNPYNPHTQFDEWMRWDTNAGYHSAGFIARIILTSDDLSEADQIEAYEAAVREIVEENVYGVHIAVTEDDVAPRTVTVSIT